MTRLPARLSKPLLACGDLGVGPINGDRLTFLFAITLTSYGLLAAAAKVDGIFSIFFVSSVSSLDRLLLGTSSSTSGSDESVSEFFNLSTDPSDEAELLSSSYIYVLRRTKELVTCSGTCSEYTLARRPGERQPSGLNARRF